MTMTLVRIPSSPDRPAVLQNRHDWPRLRRRDMGDPAPCGVDGDVDALARWVRSIGPIENSDIHGIESALHELLEHNWLTANGGRRWLAVNGPAMVGKTQAVTAAMLRVHDELLNTPPDLGAGIHASHIPGVFVSDAGASWPNLLRSIAEFAGIPLAPSTPAHEVLRTLRTVLPNLGTQFIVVDDAHMLRRVAATRDLTDRLKLTLDALPVSFVFVGAGLDNSALLRTSDSSEDEYSAAIQLAGRMQRLDLNAFTSNNAAQRRTWLRRIDALLTRLEQIDGLDTTGMRDATFAANLFDLADGLTGLSFELLKDATIHAITAHQKPTTDDLLAAAKTRGMTR